MSPKYTRGGGKLLKQKRRSKAVEEIQAPRVVYRDTAGKFVKRSARQKQGVQIIGEGTYIKPARRSRSEVNEDLASTRTPRDFSASTSSGTMAERLLQARDAFGRSLALEFSKGKQTGAVVVSAGELSFTATFQSEDLQQVLATTLSAYFQRAHAIRERVSAKAAAGKGHHRNYALRRSVQVTVKLLHKPEPTKKRGRKRK